jgi:chromatin remodeling complex protein RSC6
MAPQKKTATTQQTAPVAQATPSAEVKTPAKKAASKKSEAVQVVQATPSAEVKAPVKRAASKKAEAAPQESAVEEVKAPVERKQVSKETFDEDCNSLVKLIEDELVKLKDKDYKTGGKGVKFLKTILKGFKQIHRDGNKLTKLKKPATRKANPNGGFLKPVKITAEMAKFLGWDVNKTFSRTSVTKEICNYISTHQLNDKENRRNINCDAKLKALLKYDETTAPKDKDGKPEPLTYFRLQQYLKHHFIKVETKAAEQEIDE